ncbi:lysozyme inhibitor LprI family protein [Sneathiella chinensis]|uniref:Lysozyme inhibitor LprI-like N-terminal domain-containing protein n=1 Tax=Sneathiella chinensis TaxID=349750 RepID=A0ABQ5U395_9PROT|nr:lysozyme inhibitor LprI family protein [Sneathiella chinensis]GLQ05886.1 hypothetical protein GCM10007924_11070 [Sneathiella chinensis]
MNKKLLLLILALSSLPVANALSDASGPDHFQIRAGHTAPVHETADLNAPLLFTLTEGRTGLKNRGCIGITPFGEWSQMTDAEKEEAKTKIWCQIDYFGRSGWVQNIHLAEYGLPATPTYNCARAKGAVENLICKDGELMSLDQTLTHTYQGALARAKGLDAFPGKAVNTLRATQRGWIKGRNDCWKAGENIKTCTRDQYLQRISSLEAEWALQPSEAVTFYQCGQPANEIAVSLFNTTPWPAMALEQGDRRDILVRWISPSTEQEQTDETAFDGPFTGPFGLSVTLNEEGLSLSRGNDGTDITCTPAAS